MKFGHNLPRNQVPEWAASYINYKSLKKLIKQAAFEAQSGGTADLAEFFFCLDRNLENVDSFYTKKYAESNRRLRLLHDRYGSVANSLSGMDRDELEDLMSTLLELRGELRKLQWYGEVNRRGFVKITKKLDKNLLGAATQQRYISTKVDPKAFATNAALSADMKEVNEWLSSLGEVHISDDASSVNSAASTRIVSSRAILNLPPGLLETVDQAVRNDDVAMLSELLLEANTGGETLDIAGQPFQKLLLNLLQRALTCRSRRCIEKILQQATSLDDDEDIDQRNVIHRLIISLGRSRKNERKEESVKPPAEGRPFLVPAAQPIRLPLNRVKTEPNRFLGSTGAGCTLDMLPFLLSSLRENQISALKARDSYGRTPLHYAAQFGLSATCEIVIEHMRTWGQLDVSSGIDSNAWEDSEGLTPLHLSVIGGFLVTTKTLLAAERTPIELDGTVSIRKNKESSASSVLSLAVKADFIEIVRVLVNAGFDVNEQDTQGEVPLHIAARFGQERCAQILLDKEHGQNPNVDVSENAFAWTPLFIAAVDGHLSVAKLLIAAGADIDRVDSSGWTAKEHAALRGHLDVAACLAAEASPASSSPSEISTSPTSTSPPIGSLEERRLGPDATPMRNLKPVKTFGHRYLKNETMILVSLGSMDTRKQIEPIKLDEIPFSNAHSTQLDTALSVVVSASGAIGDPEIIDLPTQDNISTEPFTFTTTDISKVKLLFDIVPTYAGTASRIVGRGVAMLGSVKTSVGSKKMNLQGNVSVPIIAADTLEVIGCVNFNFLVITPFEHPKMSISEDITYWKRTAPMVIGHRGMGKNFGAGRRSLQLGENTLQSFIAAANLGAEYVEFDVQLTKDHVPVIYHDFLVSETGIDAPVHTLTLEQFLHVSETQTPLHSRASSPQGRQTTAVETSQQAGRRLRSYSVGSSDGNGLLAASDRMKHTRDFKEKGWKANMYGNVIKQPFTTLSEMFNKLPSSISFNIEMKYPMLFESEEHDMDTYAVELNSFVDAVLAVVYDLMGSRHVIFSSFHPDICLLLSFKQPSIPVLFLTDAGIAPVGDIRAQSLQEAIRFASRWNLLGVVAAAEPLVLCPRLVRVVKESGLVCVSYGTLNNNPENVKLQVNEGIDAVIVDHVAAFRKGLTGEEPKGSTAIAA